MGFGKLSHRGMSVLSKYDCYLFTNLSTTSIITSVIDFLKMKKVVAKCLICTNGDAQHLIILKKIVVTLSQHYTKTQVQCALWLV